MDELINMAIKYKKEENTKYNFLKTLSKFI